jgi:hypothetical protein
LHNYAFRGKKIFRGKIVRKSTPEFNKLK